MLNRYVGSSNLCCEILEPSRPARLIKESVIKEDGEEYMVTKYSEEEIALCNLASFNCNIADLPDDEMDKVVYTISLVVDNTIDIGKYMRAAGMKTNMQYRYIGLGYNNYANYMARHKTKLDAPEAEELTFKLFNKISNSIIYNNTVLAEERGRFAKFDETKWAEGIMPYDLGNTIIKNKFKHLYDEKTANFLKERIRCYGVRNALMSAIAPTASSATSKDLTESIEPILYYSYELDGAVSTRVLVPEFQKLNQYYSLAYETNQFSLVILNAIRQLFVDQSQSFNLYISEDNWNYKYLSDLHMLAWKLGVKTLYYTNTPKNSEHEVCDSCSS
jgi:ribonucleoside-diphosphate reductase alpha chain